MDTALKQRIEQNVHASHTGEMPFPDMVRLLAQDGVESYHADYRERSKTFYMPDGDSVTLALPLPWEDPGYRIADAFDESAIQDALRDAQQRRIDYATFVARTMQAGCVGYYVWIAGRNALYLGRRGETYIERFPPQ